MRLLCSTPHLYISSVHRCAAGYEAVRTSIVAPWCMRWSGELYTCCHTALNVSSGGQLVYRDVFTPNSTTDWTTVPANAPVSQYATSSA
jgi:hypothetical protein